MTAYIVRAGGKDTKVTLNDSDFVASGGEKSVYRRGGVAYCVYHDAKNVTPVAKMDELSKVKHPGFITPNGLLLVESGSRVGEVMPFVDKSHVLCELFANGFRKKQKIGHREDLSVLSQMFDMTKVAHAANVILVDPNDMNWLVSHDFKTVSLVDTLSAQTRSFPATAIKPAIRDPFMTVFTNETDYYSLAILTAWLWCGIHPFTVQIDGFKGGMPEKQLAMRSIFHPKAQLNPAVRSIETMPDSLKSWVHSHLTSKARPEPPQITGAVVKPSPVVVVVPQAGSVTWELLAVSNPWSDDEVVCDFLSNTVIRLTGANQIEVNGVPGVVEFASDAHPLSLHDGKIYLVRGNVLFQVDWRMVNGQLRFSNRDLAALADMPNATVYGEGCVVQDLLGKKVIHSEDYQGVVDLPGFRVLNAVAHSGVVMLTAIKNKKLYRVTINGDVVIEDVSIADAPNFCVTRKGIVVENRNGELIARVGGIEKRGAVPPAMRLLTDGSRVLGSMDGKPYQLHLK